RPAARRDAARCQPTRDHGVVVASGGVRGSGRAMIARTVPALPWSSRSRWRPRPSTLVVLLVGLWTFGTGEALLVASHLGNTPWTVLAQGVSRHSPLSIGAATLLVSAIVLIGWWPLRETPGLGTFANAVVIAVAIDVMLRLLPEP